ncbi:MAG: endonuclease III [Saprospiraceae bacterium]
MKDITNPPTKTIQSKAAQIQKILNKFYPAPPIPLKHKDPYTLLVAVVLSARNTDVCVNKVTPGLFARADNAADMAKVPVEEIQQLISACGLSETKAKAIKELSSILAEEHNGEVPPSFELLETLPGVGHKTASVVMSQAFNIPAFAVDTHIFRLAARWGLSDGKNVVKTERDLKAVFPEADWNKLHLQFIYFGREYCPALHHNPEKCPICSIYGVPGIEQLRPWFKK